MLQVRRHPQYRTSKYCEYPQYPQYINPKHCEYTKFLLYFYSKILYSQVLGASAERYHNNVSERLLGRLLRGPGVFRLSIAKRGRLLDDYARFSLKDGARGGRLF